MNGPLEERMQVFFDCMSILQRKNEINIAMEFGNIENAGTDQPGWL